MPMNQNGKMIALHEPPNFKRAPRRGMDKSRKYLGLETTVSKQGQITIPSLLMRKFGVEPGDKIRFTWLSQTNQRPKLTIEALREGHRLMTLRVMIRLVNSDNRRGPSVEGAK